ncbi:hypothetical protein Tco_0919524 [Tanacetum coccineum]
MSASSSKKTGIDDDEVPSEEVTPEFLVEISRSNVRWVLTSADLKQMEAALDDMMRSRCNSGEGYAYHLNQMKSYMKNQIFWESRAEDLTLQVPDNPGPVYQGCDRNPNAPTRRNLEKRSDSHEVYLDQNIVDVIRIKYDQGYRRVMDIDEIPKFCDATLERVLRNVEKINLDVKHGFKDPPLNEEDGGLMKFF